MLVYQSVTTSQRPFKEAVDRYMSPTCRPAWWHTQIRPAGRQAIASRPGAHLFWPRLKQFSQTPKRKPSGNHRKQYFAPYIRNIEVGMVGLSIATTFGLFLSFLYFVWRRTKTSGGLTWFDQQQFGICKAHQIKDPCFRCKSLGDTLSQ